MLGFRDRVTTILTSEVAKDRAAGVTVAVILTMVGLAVTALVTSWLILLVAGTLSIVAAVR